MRNRTRFILSVLASLLYAASAPAQHPADATPAAAPVVQLDVVATQKFGPPVGELRQQDFTILDNKTPQAITSFRAITGSQVPVNVTLVVDALNTSFINLGRETGEISNFLRANGGRLAQPTAVVVFTEKGFEVIGGPSQDGNALGDALNSFDFKPRTIRRSQGVYGAEDRFSLSINALRLLASSEKARPGRKIVAWISPGWPLLSGPGIQLDSKQDQQIFQTIVDLSTLMRQADMTLDSIDSLGVDEPLGLVNYYRDFVKGVRKPDEVSVGDLSLQVLATQTGGLVLNSTGVADLLEKCVADAQAYYEISFVPAGAERRDEYHHIEVEVGRPGLTARTREGYYAEP